MKIFDAHAHIYPAKIAEKAVLSIGRFYEIPMSGGSGTPEDLIASGSEIGVSRYLVHSTATTPIQVRAINNYIIGECKAHAELFTGFGTLHPDMESFDDEIEYMISNNLKGVKLHPDFQKFAIDDPKAYRLYDAVAGRLPILFHAGDKRYNYSNPGRIAAVAKRLPNLTIIAAHFGGYSEWDEAEETLLDLENVLFDTSSSLAFLDRSKAEAMISRAGAHRFMFGSDYPMWRHKAEFNRFMQLDLSDSEREAILSGNMERLVEQQSCEINSKLTIDN